MISEDVVNNILSEPIFVDKVKEYKSLQDNLYVIDVSADDNYRDIYRKFYRTGLRLRVNVKFEQEYLKILQSVKNDKNLTPVLVLDLVSAITGCCEIVFASKILHNVDTSIPIYDSVVGDEHFGYKRKSGETLEQRKQKNLQMYKDYCESFIRYTNSPDGQKIIELFDKKFPEYKDVISDVKKVDFVLWRDENGLIQIPREFKYQR